MGIKKFVNSVKETLKLDSFEKKGKKKSLKILLKKLNDKNVKLKSKLDNKKIDKKQKKSIEEELEIISVQISNGNKILKKLNS